MRTASLFATVLLIVSPGSAEVCRASGSHPFASITDWATQAAEETAKVAKTHGGAKRVFLDEIKAAPQQEEGTGSRLANALAASLKQVNLTVTRQDYQILVKGRFKLTSDDNEAAAIQVTLIFEDMAGDALLKKTYYITGDEAVSALAEPPTKGRRVALCVGVDNYAHRDLVTLKFAAKDAGETHDDLLDLGWEVTLLSDVAGKADPKRLPTGDNIRHSFKRITTTLTRDDTLLVFLTGQGFEPIGSGEVYFMPSDARPEITTELINNGFVARPKSPETLLGLGELIDDAQSSGVGHSLFFVDSCRDSPMTKGGGRALFSQKLEANCSLLLGCARGEVSYESEQLAGGHGLASHAFITGLQGAAANKEGDITWMRLVEHVVETVPVNCKQLFGNDGGEQHPTVVSNLVGNPRIGRVATPVKGAGKEAVGER